MGIRRTSRYFKGPMSQAAQPLGSPGHLPCGLALRHSDHSLGTRERTQNRYLLSYYYLFKHSEKFSTTFSVIYDFASFWHPTWGAYAVYPKSTGVHHRQCIQMVKNLYQCLPTLHACANEGWRTQHVFQSLDCPGILSKLMHFNSDKGQGLMMTHSCELNFLSCVNLDV